MRNAFWQIRSFNVYAQTPPDIMHNWSIGLLDHVLLAVVFELTRFLQSFTETKQDRGGQRYQARLITDTAIVRLFSNTLKERLDTYDYRYTGIPLSARARTRLGKYAEHLISKEKKPTNLRGDEADALFLALPTALEQLTVEFEDRLVRKGYANPLHGDPTPKIIQAIAAMNKWYSQIRKSLIAETDLARLKDELKDVQELIKVAFPRKWGQQEATAWAFPKFHQVLNGLLTIN